jgi:hypothetical protein
MNRRYDWRLGKVRSVDTGGQVIYDTALSRFRLADDGEGTPYDPLLGVRVGTLLNQTPDAPTGFIAVTYSDVRIDLTFVSEKSVSIERSTNNADFSEIATVEGGVNSYSNTGLTPYTLYYYRIRAFEGDNYSAYSKVSSDRTSYPAIIDGAETVQWQRFNDMTTITKSAANLMSAWNSKKGTTHLLQAGADNLKPLWFSDGVIFDGVATTGNKMKTDDYTLNQPFTIWMVFKIVSYVNNRVIFDGKAVASHMMQQISPGIRVTSGGNSTVNTQMTTGVFSVVRVLFNGGGGASKIQVDANNPSNESFGVTALAAFTLGACGTGASGFESNIKVREILIRSGNDSADNLTKIYNYLSARKSNYTMQLSGTYRMFVPTGFTENNKVILYCHGFNEDHHAPITDTLKMDTINAFLEQGWAVLSGLNEGNNWGNQASIDDYYAMLAWGRTLYNFTDVSIFAQSMGGCCGFQLFMTDTQFDKFIGMYPVTNLAWCYNSGGATFKNSIKTAYGISDDSEYAAKTAGHDPVLLDGALLAGRKMQLIASEGDLVVNKDNNTDLFITNFGAIADIILVTATGTHGDPSHFDPARDVLFLKS